MPQSTIVPEHYILFVVMMSVDVFGADRRTHHLVHERTHFGEILDDALFAIS